MGNHFAGKSAMVRGAPTAAWLSPRPAFGRYLARGGGTRTRQSITGGHRIDDLFA